MKDTTLNFTTPRIAIRLSSPTFSTNAEDFAGIADGYRATLTDITLAAIHSALGTFSANPAIQEIHLDGDVNYPTLEQALKKEDVWHSGSASLVLTRHAGLYLRLAHKHIEEAVIEFCISRPDRSPLITLSN